LDIIKVIKYYISTMNIIGKRVQ